MNMSWQGQADQMLSSERLVCGKYKWFDKGMEVTIPFPEELATGWFGGVHLSPENWVMMP